MTRFVATSTVVAVAISVTVLVAGPQNRAAAALPTTAPQLPAASDLTVLPAVTGVNAVLPTASGLQAALAQPLSAAALGPNTRVAVFDAATGTQIYGRGESTPATPASTTKLLTMAAALNGYGPDHQISTKVVQGASTAEIVLVGAGDPLLKVSGTTNGQFPIASLTTLAKRTAAAISAISPPVSQPITVSYDDSLFSGPTASPSWPSSYTTAGIVAPITALMADGGRVGGTVNSNPSATAATRFASLLGTRGIKVTGEPKRVVAVAGASQLAEVSSASLTELVTHTLTDSDNTAAEVLGHLAGARLGGSGSFDGGSAAVLRTLSDLGIPADGVTLYDGSGLSRQDLAPAAVLARLLSAAARNSTGGLWPLTYGSPIAGFTGTLAARFNTAATKAGRGVVRAKTGTLTGVSALSGVVVDADGAVLSFALMAPNATNVEAAADALDGAAAVLSDCGCK